jgi:hypothetical protein
MMSARLGYPPEVNPSSAVTGGPGEWRAGASAGRSETADERADRNLADLLQELRVAALGVQVLFGFLLALPFTARFNRLSGGQRDLYLATLLMAALATALLCAPVAYHRMVFRLHEKERLVQVANVFALVGLAVVGIAISSAVALVTSVVAPSAAAVLGAATLVTFGGLWFAFPSVHRRRGSG